MNSNFNKNASKQFIFGLLFLLVSFSGKSINYTFTASSGSFSPNTSPTIIWGSGDDVTANNIPIGFNFSYGGGANPVNVTELSVNSNGWIALGSNSLPNYTSYANNNLATTQIGPLIAPLWDDLSISSGGSVNYKLTGIAGTRVFTIEWLKMKWYWGASGQTISFQVKLYEANGDIEFVYRPESGNVTSASASIGIANLSSTDFYSLNNTSSLPIANYGTETATINTKPVTGQIYKWTVSSATSLNKISLIENEITVFPNPFVNEIHVSGNFDKNDKCVLTNALGVIIYETELTNQSSELKIHLDKTLPCGVYLISFINDNNRVFKRIVKN